MNKKASNLASRGELGRYPQQIAIIKRILRYTNNTTQLPDSCIVKQAFNSSKELCRNGYKSFYSNTLNILKKLHLALNYIDLETLTHETNIDNLIKDVTSGNEIFNSRKLSFYSTFKKDYKLEKYLYTIKDAHTKRSFTKFRISNHKLLIEYGRFQNVPHEERQGTMFQTKKIEDEFHLALECQLYQKQHKQYT